MESINRQKSQELWLREGDRNSKFFHLSMVIRRRRRRNRINAIQDGQTWLFEEEEIAKYLRANFEELFTSDLPNNNSKIEDLFIPCITDEENALLTRIPYEEEIKGCIWNLHPLKSLGLDGFPIIFYMKLWEIIKDKVINFVQECFKRKAFPPNVNRTFIVLILKTDHPFCFNHFCLISLCNFSYKIVAKIIVEILSGLLDRFILPNQGAFVKG